MLLTAGPSRPNILGQARNAGHIQQQGVSSKGTSKVQKSQVKRPGHNGPVPGWRGRNRAGRNRNWRPKSEVGQVSGGSILQNSRFADDVVVKREELSDKGEGLDAQARQNGAL